MEGLTLEIIITLLSGLALFLYGMNTMSDGLEKVAGNRLKSIVELFTKNRVVGVFVGAFVTVLVQSSSASTVMVIGFVNAGIMNLTQAVGIIMGANIGTTVTAQMVSFKLTELAPYAITIGVAILFFSKNSKTKNYAYVIFGFGLLFLGMHQMGVAMKPMRDMPAFKDAVIMLSAPGVMNSLLGVLIGFGFTALVQSSSATTALLVTMASEGTITIDAAFPMILGANIGTTVTAMLSSISANKIAKKAALVHLIFNVFGSVLFLVLFIIFRTQASDILHNIGSDAKRQIANAHTIFNITNTIILLPFAGVLVAIVNKILPTDEEEEISAKRLDDRMIETPVIALQAVNNEVVRMGNLALQSYKHAIDSFIDMDAKRAADTFSIERVINEMERYIADFLIKLSNSNVADSDRIYIDNMFNTINDIERIGDHADNLAELAMHRIENKLKVSDHAIDELKYMSERVEKSITQAITSFETSNRSLANQVIEREGEIDLLEKNLRKEHIRRLNEQKCTPASGVIFLDLISNLERIGDHASNIALYVSDFSTK
jgi:phosphate:Na+ symporter